MSGSYPSYAERLSKEILSCRHGPNSRANSAGRAHAVHLELRRVQRRRQFPMRFVQLVQLHFLSDLYPSTHKRGTDRPLVVRLSRRFPLLPHLIARLIALGIRSERIPDPVPGSSLQRHDPMMEN